MWRINIEIKDSIAWKWIEKILQKDDYDVIIF